MRIGLNLLPLRPVTMGGAEIYLRDLLAELLRIGGHEYVMVTRDDDSAGQDGLPEAGRRVRLGGPSRIASLAGFAARVGWARTAVRALRRRGIPGRLEALIRREAVDLWFCPFTDLQPRLCPVPAVITVHDLQHEYHAEFFSAGELRHRQRFYRESCRAADHIIAISDFTRQCVLERYAVDPARVSAVWEAASPDLDWSTARHRVDEVRRAYDLPAAYAFYPANVWPHKNHRRLLEALVIHRARGGPLHLVLAGSHVDGSDDLGALIRQHHLHGVVRILGYVRRRDVPALYAAATCLVLPSLFEGFGLPLVEAMQVGCPVIAARVASIPEVVGDAAILFDPLDPTDIARAMTEIASHDTNASDLARRGRARASLFSATTMARQTLDIFERVARQAKDGRRPPLTCGIDGVSGDR